MINSDTRMGDSDRERFADVVENSLSIFSRQQFFVWTQSSLQALVPHEILICGIDDGMRQAMSMQRFSACRYFRDEHFDVIADPLRGLRPRLMALGESWRSSVVFCPDPRGATPDGELEALVAANELKNLAACLLWGGSGKVEGLYAFSRVGVPLESRLRHVLGLIAPHVHAAYLRVLAIERAAAGAGSQRNGRLVTPRQEEILLLIKEGKSNLEIANLLGCSQWTIKNHIQAILRRLDSNSRTHAISRAISLGILKPD